MNLAYAAMLPSIWIDNLPQRYLRIRQKPGIRRVQELRIYILNHNLLMFVGYNEY
jgi:hypothetical protein